MRQKPKPPLREGPLKRIVTRTPLDELWTENGPLHNKRQRYISSTEVEILLKQSPDITLVEARVAEPLQWHPRGDYSFWRNKARHHAADPDKSHSLDDFPDSMFYFISEWLDEASQDRILLFELHH